MWQMVFNRNIFWKLIVVDRRGMCVCVSVLNEIKINSNWYLILMHEYIDHIGKKK